MPSKTVAAFTEISKSFGSVTAVDHLSFEVSVGTVFGLLGANGAGKTTAIRMLLDIISPDDGSIELFGLTGPVPGLSSRVGYLPEERGLYQRMRVVDLLVFLAEVRGVPRHTGRAAAVRWLERLGLEDWMGARVRELSKGMQQKVQFASAVMHNPSLLVLDEPFAGLDAVNTEDMGQIVKELAGKGTTVVFSTHIIEQAELLCDQVCIISGGRGLVDGSVAEIKGRYGRRRVRLRVADGGERAGGILSDVAKVSAWRQEGDWFYVVPSEGTTAGEIVSLLVGAGVSVDEFETTSDTLRQIFLDLVRGATGGVACG